MSYMSTDEQVVYKIQKYLNKLNEAFILIENSTDSQIDDGLYGLAVTQCITNLYELASKVQSDNLADKLSIINKSLRRTRNIASHDYDAINWSIVKKSCVLLFEQVGSEFIEECLEICSAEKKLYKDYTID